MRFITIIPFSVFVYLAVLTVVAILTGFNLSAIAITVFVMFLLVGMS